MITSLSLSIATNALVLLSLSYLLEAHFMVTGGFLGFLLCGTILGILNGIVRPVLKIVLKIVALPFMFVSGIIVYIVLNWFLLWLLNVILANMAVDGVQILFLQGWISYFMVALFFGIINSILHFFLGMLK